MDKKSSKDQQNKLEKPKPIKSMFARDILGIKNQIDKRLQQRGVALYYLLNGKHQSALIFGRQLLFTSSKVYKQFNDQYIEEFQQNFFYRTSKIREYIQYLLDCSIVCKIYIAAKKKQDLMQLFEKIELFDMDEKQFPSQLQTQQQIIRFNQYHQLHAKTIAILLTLIELSRMQKMSQYTQKFFKMYLAYTKKYYSTVQFATALFKYANYLFQIGLHVQAERQYRNCIQIRGKNVLNQAYVDVLVNFAVCSRQMCKHKIAIENMVFAIQIYKDISVTRERLSDFHLFLAKLYLQNGQFDESYQNMLITYKFREHLDQSDPSRVQIQLNMLFLLKTLEDIDQQPDIMLNTKQKKDIELKRKKARQLQKKMKGQLLNRQDFAKYKQFKSSKMAHLTLTISKQFYSLLSSEQSHQLDLFLKRIAQISYFRGTTQLNRCTFYIEKKLRNLLIELNPHLKNV